jgi:undecaprenyl diphosphate synthase
MNHIAFILDGNRTWAKNKNLPTFAGHKAGYDNIENTLDICLEKHIQYVSLWVLSDDNIRTRSPDEVAYLFDLLTHGIAKLARTAVKK